MLQNKDKPKIALAHDFLLYQGGAERVFKEIAGIFPEAPVFTLLKKETFARKLLGKERIIQETFLKKLPFFFSHRMLLPFYPVAVESLNLREFDLVISSTSSFMKGLVVKPRTIHICYCHAPTRFLWDYSEEYLNEAFKKKGFFRTKKILARIVLNYLRMWDQSSARRVDLFIANSQFTQKRIKKYYKKKSEVIYPPVAVERFWRTAKKEGKYFLIVSRLSSYKNIDLAIEAFNRLKWPLFVAGEGKEKTRLKKMANPNIRFLGFVPEKKLPALYAGCRALIFPGEDDFGITMVEAMASGKPVLALRAGGALEIVEEGKTGEFFSSPEAEIMVDGLRRLVENEKKYDYLYIRESVRKFNRERFRGELLKVVKKKIENIIIEND